MQPGFDIYIYKVPESRAVSTSTDGFLLHLQQNPYPGLHDPLKSIFLFLKKIRVATGPGLSVLPAPLSQIPALPRAKCFSSVSFQLNYHLLT